MNRTMKWTCKPWKSMNWNYELDYELMYEMTMKWLWNDYEMTMNFDMKWTMKQPMKYWYELTMNCLLQVWKSMNLCMKKYFSTSLLYENVWKSIFQQAFIWKCMNHLNIVSYEVCIYLGLNDTGRARRDSYEAL